jgi:hypothetical protein
LSIKAITPYCNDQENTGGSNKEQESTCISTIDQTTMNCSIFKRIMGDIYVNDDPKVSFSQTKKNTVVLLVALIGINGSIAQLIYMPGIYQMIEDLNTSLLGIDATVSTYILFAGIAVRSISFFVLLYLGY